MEKPRHTYIWEGIYSSFDEVISSRNPHNDAVWAKMLLDSLSVAINCLTNNQPISVINLDEKNLLPFLVSIISNQREKPVSILDFGGGIGVDFLYTTQCLGEEKINKYVIVETENVCQLGAKIYENNPRVEFCTTVPHAIVDIVYFDSALQYVDNYQDLLLQLAECQPEYFLFLRTPAGNIPTYVSAQMNVSDSIIPYRFLNMGEFSNFMSASGYTLKFSSSSSRAYDQSNFPPAFRLGHTNTMLFVRNSKHTGEIS